tara:strand:+ start:4315 stop:5097 length:783 start_codon:yes stop_codon:yes gene_type:complete
MSVGGLFGGKTHDYAGAYSKYKPDAKFSKYVDGHKDLTDAWNRIQSDPDHPDSQYWIKRGASSKEAFGRAHAAEDAALQSGNYMGSTGYKQGNADWNALFDSAGKSRYDRFLTGSSGADWRNTGTTNDTTNDTTNNASSDGLLDQAWSDNLNFPLLQSDYTIPSYSAVTNPWTGQTIGSEYMPWTAEGMANVPMDARSYMAPELTLEHPQYIDNPYGLLELPEDWEDLLDMGEDEEDEDDDDDDDDEDDYEGAPNDTSNP